MKTRSATTHVAEARVDFAGETLTAQLKSAETAARSGQAFVVPLNRWRKHFQWTQSMRNDA